MTAEWYLLSSSTAYHCLLKLYSLSLAWLPNGEKSYDQNMEKDGLLLGFFPFKHEEMYF